MQKLNQSAYDCTDHPNLTFIQRHLDGVSSSLDQNLFYWIQELSRYYCIPYDEVNRELQNLRHSTEAFLNDTRCVIQQLHNHMLSIQPTDDTRSYYDDRFRIAAVCLGLLAAVLYILSVHRTRTPTQTAPLAIHLPDLSSPFPQCPGFMNWITNFKDQIEGAVYESTSEEDIVSLAEALSAYARVFHLLHDNLIETGRLNSDRANNQQRAQWHEIIRFVRGEALAIGSEYMIQILLWDNIHKYRNEFQLAPIYWSLIGEQVSVTYLSLERRAKLQEEYDVIRWGSPDRVEESMVIMFPPIVSLEDNSVQKKGLIASF